jgi:hypothetical protein
MGPDEERVTEADHEYEFASDGNWIKRTVWVWAKASVRQEKYETQTRKLMYFADDRDHRLLGSSRGSPATDVSTATRMAGSGSSGFPLNKLHFTE